MSAIITLDVSVGKRWPRYCDLICCALESGSYATFGIGGYDKPPELTRLHEGFRWDESNKKIVPTLREHPEVFKHVDYPVNVGGAVWLYNRYDEKQGGPGDGVKLAPWVKTKKMVGERDNSKFMGLRLDIDALEKGVIAWSEKCPNQFTTWLYDSPAEDAITGDTFLQCCMFESGVVYG